MEAADPSRTARFGSPFPDLRFDLASFHEGDEVLLNDLLDRLRPFMRAAVRKWARSLDHTDDLEQDTMIRVYEKRIRFSGRSSLLTWAWTVCLNVCREDARPAESAEIVPMAGRQLEDDGPDPEEEWERSILATEVESALATLKPSEREVVRSHYWEGRTLSEIARAMGKRRETAAALLRRALHKLGGLEELAELALDEL